MKKILLTIIFTFVCCFMFAENVSAYTYDYGAYFDDTLGYWDAEKQEATSTYPSAYSWSFIWTFDDSTGTFVVSNYDTGEVYTNGQKMTGTKFFKDIYAPRLYRTETGNYSAVKEAEYNIENTLFGNIDEVTLFLDYSAVQEYYDKYGEMPDVIYVVDIYKKIGDELFWYPTTAFQDVIEYFSPIDIGQYDPILGWQMIIDYIAGTDYASQPKSKVEAHITFAISDFEFDPKDFGIYIGNGYYPIAKTPYADFKVCYGLEFYIDQLKTISEKEKDGCYSLEYREFYSELDKKCDNYIKIHKDPDLAVEKACINLCRSLPLKTEEFCNMKDDKNRCGIGPKTMNWVVKILKIGRYIIPVLVIILSILDFITAIASSEEDALKKAGTKFAKRVVASVIIFLLPAFLQFLFDTFKIAGLNSSNPYCMK